MVGRAFFIKLLTVVVGMTFSIVTAHSDTSVSVAPAAKNILPSSILTLSFTIANVTNIHAYHLVVDYDNAILHYDGASPGTFINSSLFFPSFSDPHTIDIAHSLVGNGTVTSGSGLLFTLQFTSIAPGTSPVTITSVDLRDGSNNYIIPVTINSGSVTVANPDIVWTNPTYTPGSCGGHDFGYNAFTTVTNGVSAVNSNGTVNIASATYNESVSITKDLTLTGAGNPTVQNLTVNTPAVTIGGDIQVNGVLTLTSGVITTGSNKITLTNDQPDGVVITGGSIAGQICRAIQAGNTGTYMFTNQYTQIVPSPTQPATTISLTSFPGQYPPAAPPGTAMNRYYTISPSPSNFSADLLRLEFLPSENISEIQRLNWGLFRNDGVSWIALESYPDLTTKYFAFVASVAQWSTWAIGDVLHPLPIQLSSFTGRVVNSRDVRLDWTTLGEIRNYGFEVQKAATATTTFETIPNSFVPGHGTTNTPHSYTFTENNTVNGNWYYRLKQTDLDGTVHYSDPIQIDVLTDVKADHEPAVFSLEQNYPNPFNPSTNIKFGLPGKTMVTLEVFNVLGERIATLFSEEMTRGTHSVTWKAENASSGVYLLRLSAGGFVSTKKMLLSK